ncbi:hypothetical protein [Paenibacillus azoreducens]|uniref:Uncharacterized protein n=1 Tax=Paenibacillus azoreducens TaxID=116718 RepID=A0A919YCQ8_9BACL|nr:hypothetical protein [Paenibacillus azoreducens]GIO46380.1 hypothetical protein J34TS1_11450 [Paenibacillus azoreducens]
MGKAYAEHAGSWPYGVEMPVLSLKEQFRLAGIRLMEEQGIGFVESLDFLDFIPGSGGWKESIRLWYTGLEKKEQQLFPGYLLLAHGIV